MLASTDLRTSAAADFWLALQADLASLLRAGCEPDDEACGRHADETRARGEGAAERLVRKALRSGDPVVYCWAFQVCRHAAADAPSCQLVSAAQWARLSPGNAFAWFAVAEEASARKNVAALDAAMFQIASAERVDSATFVLPGLLADHSVGDGSDALVAAASRCLRAPGFEWAYKIGDRDGLRSGARTENLGASTPRASPCPNPSSRPPAPTAG